MEPAMTTAIMEDYLERIYELIQEKGYARVVDLSERLKVRSSSVTKMIQKLGEQGFVKYEKYRGLVLTPKGENIAKAVKRRHRALEDFLHILGVEESVIQKDIEGIEHHLSPNTLEHLRDLVGFLQEHPQMLKEFEKYRSTQKHS